MDIYFVLDILGFKNVCIITIIQKQMKKNFWSLLYLLSVLLSFSV